MSFDSQNLESFLPVYDTVPEKWEEGRQFLVEQLKKISNAVNVREIGYFLDEEVLTGQQFIPGAPSAPTAPNSTPLQFRSIFRIVVDFSPLIVGANTRPHGVTIDARFTLMHLYAAATNAGALTGEPIPNGADTISYDATNIIITVAAAYTRCFAVMEFIQEL